MGFEIFLKLLQQDREFVGHRGILLRVFLASRQAMGSNAYNNLP
jgi:hypothetical protein